jgi:hypothetical protein
LEILPVNTRLFACLFAFKGLFGVADNLRSNPGIQVAGFQVEPGIAFGLGVVVTKSVVQ